MLNFCSCSGPPFIVQHSSFIVVFHVHRSAFIVSKDGKEHGWQNNYPPRGEALGLNQFVHCLAPRTTSLVPGGRAVSGSNEVWYGGKKPLRCDLIERSGSGKLKEFEPTGGKKPLRPHVIEAGGSNEVWYGGKKLLPPGLIELVGTRKRGIRITGGKKPLPAQLIEASGSSEAWYGGRP
ncbi:MAG: hypothetical protein HZA21_01115 [Nitrospirae bacterium]|nr:hypothetical protein [Nitrospirota bacterium]